MVLRADLLDPYVIQLVVVAHEVAVQLYVLVSARDDRVLDHLYTRLVVLVQYSGMLFFSADFREQVAQPHYVFRADGGGAVLCFRGGQSFSFLQYGSPMYGGTVVI